MGKIDAHMEGSHEPTIEREKGAITDFLYVQDLFLCDVSNYTLISGTGLHLGFALPALEVLEFDLGLWSY